MADTINHKLYEIDRLYKDDSNLVNYIDEAQNFYDGNQYPNANFKNMIRVTLNICSFSATIKASKICGTPIYLTFTSDDQDTDCTGLRRFDEYNCQKMKMKTSNFQAALNGFVNGTEVTFIRWDDDDMSYKGIYKGGLVEEHIDLRNFAVANPYINDIQNQQWIMFWEDYPVRALKEMVEGDTKEEKEEKRKLIERSVCEEGEYKNKAAINHSLCRMFTRFFRVNGEVYFMCSTENVDLFKYPKPLSRKLGKVTGIATITKVVEEYKKMIEEGEPNEDDDIVDDYKIDVEDTNVPSYSKERLSETAYVREKEKFYLYPFAVFTPFVRNRSFYGRSDIKQMIPIQKAINFAISMELKCMENNAYNKIIVKPDALQGQKVTNEPSQVLVDHSGFTNGWGIKFAESQPMPNGLIDFTDKLLGMTRIIYSFNDVMDGSVTNKDMSGYMLQQMIKQANTSIEQQQQIFWVYNEDKAAIRLLYYKHYVDKAKYSYQLSEGEYEGEEQARQIMYAKLLRGQKLEAYPEAKAEDFANPTKRTRIREIAGDDLYGRNFDISIEAMQGLADSKLVEQQMWDNLLLNGGINNISPELLEMYMQASPNISQRTRDALKNVIENLKQSKIRSLEGNLQEMAQTLDQVMQYAKRLEAMNGYQGAFLKNVQSEFSQKINAQNKIIGGLVKDLDQYRGYSEDTSEGEVKSNNSRGIAGTHTR